MHSRAHSCTVMSVHSTGSMRDSEIRFSHAEPNGLEDNNEIRMPRLIKLRLTRLLVLKIASCWSWHFSGRPESHKLLELPPCRCEELAPVTIMPWRMSSGTRVKFLAKLPNWKSAKCLPKVSWSQMRCKQKLSYRESFPHKVVLLLGVVVFMCFPFFGVPCFDAEPFRYCRWISWVLPRYRSHGWSLDTALFLSGSVAWIVGDWDKQERFLWF